MNLETKEITYIDYPKEDRTKFLYKLIKGKSGRGWLYPIDSVHPADDIYCTAFADWNKRGEGFAGSTLNFLLAMKNDADDYLGEFQLHGGWHSNASDLLLDTGIDITDKYLSRIVISLGAESRYPKFVLSNILYEENVWVVGEYNRGDKIARKFANDLGVPVYCYRQSIGGSSMGWEKPDTVSE